MNANKIVAAAAVGVAKVQLNFSINTSFGTKPNI